jgi:hypothetical protein
VTDAPRAGGCRCCGTAPDALTRRRGGDVCGAAAACRHRAAEAQTEAKHAVRLENAAQGHF